MIRRTPLRRQYTHVCETCGSDYHPDGRTSRYCSRACAAIGHTLPPLICERCGGNRDGRKHPSRRFCSRTCSDAAAVKPRKTCPICHVRPVALGSKTCGNACGYELRKQSIRPRPCPRCGVDFRPYPSALARGAGKYCSRSCYQETVGLRPAFVALACAVCGTGFRRSRAAVARTTNSFCSQRCASSYNSGERSGVWRGGHSSPRGSGWVRRAEEIRLRDGYRCRRCGKTQAEEGQRLSVDHVIPWRSFTDEVAANDPSNLVALCRSCHGHKAGVERRWLKGDVLGLEQYRRAVAEPWPSDLEVAS